jgi:hypothetical protein
MIFKYVMFIILGFLSGSILYSLILPRLFCKVDITEQFEDKNPGAANAIKSVGPYIGMICLILDILKGFVPVYIATRVVDYRSTLFFLIMAAPVLGHALGMFNGWQGGKAISVSFGVLLGVIFVSYQLLLLAGLYIIFSTIIKIQPHARRTVIVFLLFAAIQLFFPIAFSLKLGALVSSGTVTFKNWADSLLPSPIRLRRG